MAYPHVSRSFFTRTLKLDYPNAETTKASKKYVKAMKHLVVSSMTSKIALLRLLTQHLQDVIPPTTPFNREFLDLLRKIFVYDPKRRITAKEALKHPWFREQVRDDGTEALKLRLAREDEQRINIEDDDYEGAAYR